MSDQSGSAVDNKSKRYDRQIRIWGAEGQQRLEHARIALLNCSPTGSETLKNLVLGGIASFTIVDGKKVQPRDLGNNFLVDAARLGHSRAQVVTDLLKEMNDAVSGSYVEDTPEELLENNPSFLEGFDLVIATQVGLQDTSHVQLLLCAVLRAVLLA
jgi:amyloid beta precursor protein binding protein 1